MPWSLFTPRKDPVPIVQEGGWAPGPVWTGAENIASTGIWSPDRLARSQSLYRLCYLAHLIKRMVDLNYRWPVMSKWKQYYDEINKYVIYYTTCTENQSKQIECKLCQTMIALQKAYNKLIFNGFYLPPYYRIESVTVGQMLHHKPSDFSETSGVSEDNDGFNLTLILLMWRI